MGNNAFSSLPFKSYHLQLHMSLRARSHLAQVHSPGSFGASHENGRFSTFPSILTPPACWGPNQLGSISLSFSTSKSLYACLIVASLTLATWLMSLLGVFWPSR